MRLLLQQRPLAGEPPRYVQLILQQDLLGGWQLLRESGQTGGKATLKREQFLEQKQAIEAFEKARDAQLKRGFQVMFAQGANHHGG
jgi:predicted DNA-binding WGR domain protein